MYDADAKKKQRTEDRKLKVGGFTYPRKPWTIALDQELDPYRARLDDYANEYGEIAAKLDPEKNLSKAKQVEVAKRMVELDVLVVRERMAMIVALLEPDETGGTLTTEVLEEHLELEDVSPILNMLQSGELTLGGPDPTGDSASA